MAEQPRQSVLSPYIGGSIYNKAANGLVLRQLAVPGGLHGGGKHRTMSQAQQWRSAQVADSSKLLAKLAWHDRWSDITPTLQLRTTTSLSAPPPIAPAMFVQRSAFAVARRAAPRALARRTFTTSFIRRESRRELRHTMHF